MFKMKAMGAQNLGALNAPLKIGDGGFGGRVIVVVGYRGYPGA